MASITITVPDNLRGRLLKRAVAEGRSLSNLAAYLLEHSLDQKERAAAAEAKPNA